MGRPGTFALFVCLALISRATIGDSAPAVGLSWNACSPRQYEQYFTGQKAYRAILFVDHLSGPVKIYGVDLEVRSWLPRADYCGGPGDPDTLPDRCKFPDAWRFDAGLCQGLGRVMASKGGAGCPDLNPQSDSVFVITSHVEYVASHLTDVLVVQVGAIFDEAVIADPQVRYSLVTLEFDHSHSVVGPTSNGDCGNVERGMTLMKGYYALFGPDLDQNHLFEAQMPAGAEAVWLGESTVPIQGNTWGRIRASYR